MSATAELASMVLNLTNELDKAVKALGMAEAVMDSMQAELDVMNSLQAELDYTKAELAATKAALALSTALHEMVIGK